MSQRLSPMLLMSKCRFCHTQLQQRQAASRLQLSHCPQAQPFPLLITAPCQSAVMATSLAKSRMLSKKRHMQQGRGLPAAVISRASGVYLQAKPGTV